MPIGAAHQFLLGIVAPHPIPEDVSDYFQRELKHFGVRQSLAYVGEPQPNGVIERFWETLKKQVLEGRIYQTLADLRAALVEFMGLYNRAWRLEKLGGRTPDEARQAWETKQAD